MTEKTEFNSQDYIKSGEAQKILRVSLATLRRWHSEGGLGGVKLRNVWHYSCQDLLDIIKEEKSNTRVGRMRFHDLRHTCASSLLAQDPQPRVVMEILGHSQISLTLNTYSHVRPAARHGAADRIQAMLVSWTAGSLSVRLFPYSFARPRNGSLDYALLLTGCCQNCCQFSN